jgi:hypothetical protein
MSDTKTEKTEKPKSKKDKKARGPRRYERRFVAQSHYNPWLVRLVGALGALSLGAGAFAFFYGESFKRAAEAAKAAGDVAAQGALRMEAVPSYLIAAGAVLTGVAIWLGTSSETPLRVGDPGIAMERGEVRRMPWWGITQITWESGNLALVIVGKDEAGTSWSFKVPVNSHAEAAGWILKEALDRVPKVVDIRDDVLDKLPGANPHAGMKVELEPLQVVGKRDALTNKTISYEPDAKVCTRCERVYYKRTVPKKCKCGASLLELRASVVQDDEDDDDDDDDVVDSDGADRDDDEPTSEKRS